MNKKITYYINLVLQITLVTVLLYLNNISMKYYGTPKTKLIVNAIILLHSFSMIYLFMKKHPFTNSKHTLILSILLLAPLVVEMDVKKPTDEMVLDYFKQSEYADEEIVKIQHTLEDDYRYVVITLKDQHFHMHIYQNDQIIKNYIYHDLKIDQLENENFRIIPIVENRKLYQRVPVYSNEELYYLYYLVNNDYDIQVTSVHITDDLKDNLTQINENIYHHIILDTIELDEQSEYILASMGSDFVIHNEYSKGEMVAILLLDQNYEFNSKFIYLKQNPFHETFILKDDSKLYYQDGKLGVNLYTEEGKKVLYYFDIHQLTLPPKLEYLK